MIVNIPVVLRVPVPLIVLLPLTPRAIPPLAVMLLLLKLTPPDELVKLKLPEPRLIAPVVIPPVELTVIELGVPEIVPSVKVLAPWLTVTPPVSFMFSVPTLVEILAAPLPDVNDKVPVELRTPEPVIVAVPLVLVDNVMPPLAVTAPLTAMLLLFVVTDNDPEPSLLVLS